jgi:hypothetical protein
VPRLPSLLTPSAIRELDGDQNTEGRIVFLGPYHAGHPALDTQSVSFRALHALQRNNGIRGDTPIQRNLATGSGNLLQMANDRFTSRKP